MRPHRVSGLVRAVREKGLGVVALDRLVAASNSAARVDRAAQQPVLAVENEAKIGSNQRAFSQKARTPGIRAGHQVPAQSERPCNGRDLFHPRRGLCHVENSGLRAGGSHAATASPLQPPMHQPGGV